MTTNHVLEHAALAPTRLVPPGAEGAGQMALAELLVPLSRALDLAEGRPMGAAVRACTVGLRMAEELRLPDDERLALAEVLLLSDAGGSSVASGLAALFGADDRLVKPRLALLRGDRPFRLARRAWGVTGIGLPPGRRVGRCLAVARGAEVLRALARRRAERGAELARSLGLDERSAEAIGALDERWDGRGEPGGRAGERIPRLARLASLARALATWHAAHGTDAALRLVRRRRGTWFDPRLVELVRGWRADAEWWRRLADPRAEERLAETLGALDARRVDAARLGAVAETFAEITDAKSPFTARHSRNVARYAVGMARAMGLDAGAVESVRLAGLLHDVGKLGVSSRILDRNGPLDADERQEVERHPAYTWEILSRARAFGDIAWVAATHHEALDGSGYPWGLDGRHLDTRARILAVADVYEALTAERPYREGMPRDQALAIIARERGIRLCPKAVEALEAWTGGEGRSEGEGS